MKAYEALKLKKKPEWFSKAVVLFKKKLNKRLLFEQILPTVFAFVLARTVVFNDMAPFGVAFYAAFMRGKKDVFLPIITAIAYVSISSQVDIYKYISIIILIYAIPLGFEKNLVDITSQFKMPGVAGAASLLVGVFFCITTGFLVYDFLLVLLETMIISCVSYFFAKAIFKVKNLPYEKTIENEDLISCIILTSLLLLALSDVYLGDISIGRILGIFIVLFLAQSRNMAVAAITGLVFGLALGIYDRSLVSLCVIYGFCGIICGIFSHISRIVGVSSFIILMSVMVVYFDGSAYGVMWIIESLIAGTLSLLVPKNALKSLKLSFNDVEEKNSTHEDKLRELVLNRLTSLSHGYKDVFESVITLSDKLLKTNFNNITTVYDMASKKACRGCSLLNACWQRDYNTTVDCLNKVTNKLIQNSKISKTDLPLIFTNRCGRLDIFVENINDCYKEYKMRQKLALKQQQATKLSCQQYISLAKVMEQTANELSQKVVFDVDAEERIIKFLNKKEIIPKVVMVIIDDCLRTQVEIDIDFEEHSDLSISKECLLEKISQITGAPLTEFNVTRRKDNIKISLSTKEKFNPCYAFVSGKKEGETISGDNVGVFKTEKSKLVMQIGDGMGSGQRAAIDSAVATNVIKKIIQAGFGNDAAITILNSAILLKSDDENLISIDIAVLDLYTGYCEFLKLGAAPTYIMRSSFVSRIDSNSLPVGILDRAQAKSTAVKLGDKDIIVMVSDGVISNGDEFVFDILQNNKELEPKDICALILNAAKQKSDGIIKDDMSVICTKI